MKYPQLDDINVAPVFMLIAISLEEKLFALTKALTEQIHPIKENHLMILLFVHEFLMHLECMNSLVLFVYLFCLFVCLFVCFLFVCLFLTFFTQ